MKARRLNISLLVALLLACAASLLAGRVWINPFEPVVPNATLILGQLRLPRTVLALIIGAGLGMSGAAMQGYLRNPLADPGLFGISPAAALGAVLALFFGYSLSWLMPVFAWVGAGGAMLLLGAIAGRSASIILFTLAGMMVASLAGSLMALAISLSPTPFAMSEIITWLMGAISDRSWSDVLWALVPTLLGAMCLLATRRSLDALTLGEDAARSMGINPSRLQWLMIGGVGLTVGAGVAVAGMIGFVGLMVPHLMRAFTDQRPSTLLVPSALAGALLLLVADTVIRILPMMTELRLGIAMSLIGGPFFLALLLRMRRRLA